MSRFQKLSQINKDIELLEQAGKIKEAEIMHKKFIREAQYVMPQMMPMMMPQMMMPQMMMARPTMPVAPAAVPRPVAAPQPAAVPQPVAQPASVAPASIPKPPAPVGQTPKPGATPAPPPGGITYQIDPPQSSTLPPSNDQRFDHYNEKMFKGYEIEDPRLRQQYFDYLKKKIQQDFDNGRLDKTHKDNFDDMFAGG